MPALILDTGCGEMESMEMYQQVIHTERVPAARVEIEAVAFAQGAR
jgi:hypothetical protein